MNDSGNIKAENIRPDVELLFIATIIRGFEGDNFQFSERELAFATELPEDGILVTVGKQEWRVKPTNNNFLQIQPHAYLTNPVPRGTYVRVNEDGNYEACSKQKADFVAIKDCERTIGDKDFVEYKYKSLVKRTYSIFANSVLTVLYVSILIPVATIQLIRLAIEERITRRTNPRPI